jgi:hypothetical protein
LATDSVPAIASHKLQSGLLSIQKWLKTWRMTANGTKSTHITFTTRRATCPPVHINNVKLPQVEEFRYLGLHLDRRLFRSNRVFAKRKQRGITLTKMYWLLGRQSDHWWLLTTKFNKFSMVLQVKNIRRAGLNWCLRVSCPLVWERLRVVISMIQLQFDQLLALRK